MSVTQPNDVSDHTLTSADSAAINKVDGTHCQHQEFWQSWSSS